MCGIGGILRTDGQPIPEEWLDAIDARIAYRGPDGHGRFRDRVEIDDASAPGGKRIVEVAFVHRRLSIIDHKDGAQPMVSERGRNDKEGLVAVVFNGCIYNHRELRKELEAKGHTFVTDHSDTEVLIHGWREWNEALPAHLEGMFAFAVWDRTLTSVFVARDRFGEKPLYARVDESFDDVKLMFTFASCARALSAFDRDFEAQGTVNQPSSTQYYLQRGYVGSWYPWVFVADHGEDYDIAAGHSDMHDMQNRTMVLTPWFTASDAKGPAQAPLTELIEGAVARRLDSDVPLGCFLSGGVDSSLVSHFAMRHKPDLQTFSVRMPDPRYDESACAEIVARHLGTSHTTLDAAILPAEDLVFLIHTLGQPFGDSSILPTYWVSKAARQQVKVALSGDGGDEMFCGYDRYLAAPFLSQHWKWLRLLPASRLHKSHPKTSFNKFARLVDMARDYPSLGLAAMESVFTLPQIAELIERPFTRPGPKCNPDDAAIASLRQFDVEHYLPGDLLTKVDTASMACGLEVRCPFLDRDLARAALVAPIEQLMPGGQRKGLLRQIARKYLPKEIVDRPKMGFAIPIGEWFRSDYGGMKTLLLDHLNSAEPFGPIQLNRKAVQRFIDEHMSGKRDHGQRLFTLLTLSIWARKVAK